MANTDSPRDHGADANPDVARKRARLSESPDSSDTVPIQAFAPEDISGGSIDYIQIEDDDGLDMDPFDDLDRLWPSEEEARDLQSLQKNISSDYYLPVKDFHSVSLWLSEHLEGVEGEDRSLLLELYTKHEAYFHGVVTAGLSILQRNDIFDPAECGPASNLGELIGDFIISLVHLSIRYIQILPDITKDQLARRDSAQERPVKAGEQCIAPLVYLHVLDWVLALKRRQTQYLRVHLNLDLEKTKQTCVEAVQDAPQVFPALMVTLRDLSCNAREVKDAWLFIDCIFRIMNKDYLADIADKDAEEMIHIVNELIMPIVREKHPRALPDGFHHSLIQACGDVFGMQVGRQANNVVVCFAMYERLVKSNDDALFPSATRVPDASALAELSAYDEQNCAALLRAAWTLQALKAFIFSSIMDIRSCGIALLCDELRDWYKGHSGDAAHPVLHYAARFLKQNQFTSYIFGVDSHASIISGSRDIVDYLAVTGQYTDDESDIIWQACTTNVEVELVKASFMVLHHVVGNLPFDRVLHVVNKYATTPAAKLSNHAALDMLSKLFHRLHGTLVHSNAAEVERSHVVGLDSALKVLQHLHRHEQSQAVSDLCQLALTEISCARSYPPDARRYLYERCVPAILDRSEAATASVDALVALLNMFLTQDEAEQLLTMLPVSAAVAELHNFVSRAKECNLTAVELRSRIALIARLLSLTPDTPPASVQAEMFECLFGADAMSNVARNSAWMDLANLTGSDRLHSVTTKLLKHYLDDFVPSMSVDFATPILVSVSSESLKQEIKSSVIQGTDVQPLGLPLWKTLVRFATECQDQVTAGSAVNAICDLLFVWPQHAGAKESIAQTHVQFVKDFVDWLCNDFVDFDGHAVKRQASRFQKAILLLSTVLNKSKEMQSSAQLVAPLARISLDGGDADFDALYFALQVCTPQGSPMFSKVQATMKSTVAELVSALPSRTGAASNRVIIGGKSVDVMQDREKTLYEVGVQASGVIMICPIFTPDADLDVVLTASGPVEQEMLVQYDRLEPFLDGPEPIARSAYGFLTALRPSNSARLRVCSDQATAAELFPCERPHRTAYSAHVLKRNLMDYARLGVADASFILHGVRLLTATIMDASRPIDGAVLSTIASYLGDFLRERPQTPSSLDYFEDATSFAMRMVDLLEHTAQAQTGRLALTIYDTLLQAARVDHAVWRAFSQDHRFNNLYALLCLSENRNLSASVMNTTKGFCDDLTTPENSTDVYWRSVAAVLPIALSKVHGTSGFFDFAAELLTRNTALHAKEESVRDLAQSLLGQIWAYRHQESPETQMADDAMCGLLRLLLGTVTVLKSLKKPVALPQVAHDVFTKLLFTDAPWPLIHKTTRALAFDLIRATCETHADYQAIAQLADAAIQALPTHPYEKFPGHNDWVRSANMPAGLTNLGMTCYMNSLVQQLFANVSFRRLIFDAPVTDSVKQVVLVQLQGLFAHMQDGPLTCVDTKPLSAILGINIQNQEDVHTFYGALLSRLEDGMPDDKLKKAVAGFYGGKFVSQVKGECGHVSSRHESFTDVSITVKNKASLQESLEEFVQGEPMHGANKYKCAQCDAETGGRLVDAVKRTCLEETPDNLTLCLKRFTFEAMVGLEGKVNDRFDFPAEIDMAQYQRSHLEHPENDKTPDIFDLVGVIVHWGTLTYGHYWSYVRMAASAQPPIWMRLEDTNANICTGFDEVLAESSGGLFDNKGNERGDNAYVLFYQRRDAARAQMQQLKQFCAPPDVVARLPPRVPAPPQLTQEMFGLWHWRLRIAHLFSPLFSNFIDWLVDNCPSQVNDEDRDIDSTSSPVNPLLDQMATMSEKYLLHLLRTDAAPAKKVASFLQALRMVELSADERDYFEVKLLSHAMDDTDWLASVWQSPDAAYRSAITKMFETLLTKLSQFDVSLYYDSLRKVSAAHCSQLSEFNALHDRWTEYFAFAKYLAGTGVDGTLHLLNAGYLDRIWEFMYIQVQDNEIRKKYSVILDKTKRQDIDLTPVFDFVAHLLNNCVAASTADLDGTTYYIERDGRAVLKQRDLEQLFLTWVVDKQEVCLLPYVACKTCPLRLEDEWVDYAPGRLLRALMKHAEGKEVHMIHQTFAIRLRVEQDEPLPLLSMILNYCYDRKENESRELLKLIIKPLLLWAEGWAPEVVRFWSIAAKIARGPTIDCVPDWATLVLCGKKQQVRRDIMLLLGDHVFTEPIPNLPETAARLRTSRALVAKCLPTLTNSYDKGYGMSYLPHMLNMMKMAEQWLTDLHKEIHFILEDEERKRDADLSPEVMVEYDESRATLSELRNTLLELKDWQINVPPVAAQAASGMSLTGGDGGFSDAEEEMASSDDLSDLDDAPGEELDD